MNENINQQPERAVLENDEQINNIIVDIFKNTGQRITKDDPILSLFFLNSELQKQQSKLLESNFISLTEGFRHVLTSLENENLQRFKEVVESCGNVEKEIKEMETVLKLVHRQAGTRDWVDTGNYRFRMSVAAGRTTLDKDALREELTEIFHAEHLGDIDVNALLARCERTGSPFEKLSISPIN